MPIPRLVAIYCGEQGQNREAIVETSQQKDAMHALRQNQQRENVRWDLEVISTNFSLILPHPLCQPLTLGSGNLENVQNTHTFAIR